MAYDDDYDEHEISRMQDEGGHAHPDGEHVDQERADADLAAAAQSGDTAETMLRQFAGSANWSLLHPADHERFEQLMRLATEANWAPTELEAKLLQCGLPGDLAAQLRRKYWNRRRPLPMGIGRQELNAEIAKMNERLGCGRNASADGR